MCLAVTGKITEIKDGAALINFDGVLKEAALMLCPQAKPGDYVLVHAGFIIQLLQEDEGLELARLNRELKEIL
ncbi:MAG: HypC/HybG/HupF family hydrogenase formation chaperone [Clostridiales bacterium]|nr:HypC/HybG/HupF family hydrogenase formation chaperone [Clostridiales bacterium]